MTKKRSRWGMVLTILSAGIILGSFVARDQVLSSTQDELHGLDAAETTISVQTDLSSITLGVLTTVNILSHPKSERCSPKKVEQIKTVGDGRAEAICLLSTFAATKPILDTLIDAADEMPPSSKRAATVDNFRRVGDGMWNKIRDLQATMEKDARTDAAPLSNEMAVELIKTYNDASSIIQKMAASIQNERDDINTERLRLNRKAKVATLWTDGLFLLGWIVTVGGKLEGADAAVE
jgi:hypothetical protein